MHREAVEYIHSVIVISHKKEWNLPFATTWMELEGIRLSELSPTEKEMLYDLSYRSNLRQTRNKAQQTHRYREQTGGRQRQGGGGRKRSG